MAGERAGRFAARDAPAILLLYPRHQAPEACLVCRGVLFSSDPALYRPHTALDQWGTGFHREPVFPPPNLDQQQSVQMEVKVLIRRALLAAASQQPQLGLSTDPDDYYLSCFNIGWEGIGHWESDCELSNPSLRGQPRGTAALERSDPSSSALRYHVEDNAITIRNGTYFNNRPLYNSHGPGWVLTGDRPLVRFLGNAGMNGCWTVGIGRNGHTKWLQDWDDVTARYRSGRMEWLARDRSLPGLSVAWEVVAQAGREAFSSRLQVQGAAPVDVLVWLFGGVKDAAGVSEKFDPVWLPQFTSDAAAKSPVLRLGFLSEACAGNEVTPREDGFSVRGTDEPRRKVHARCTATMDVKVANAADWDLPDALPGTTAGAFPAAFGGLSLSGITNAVYWAFEAGNADYSPTSALLANPEELFRNATRRVDEVANRVVVDTPEASLNVGVAAASHALDSVFYPPVYRHGAMAWNLPFPGWRVLYGGTAFGWHDACDPWDATTWIHK